jgi:hypothetical protein
VFGFSKQKSVRRIFITDTNDNSTDFESVDYRVNGITAEVLEVKQPRNSAYGPWNPAREPDAPKPPESSEKLMILQAYGAGPNKDGAVSHTFVELYNNTNADINLSTYSIQYADGISASVDTVSGWTVINLTGTIPAYSSFLIRGVKMNDDSGGTVGRLQINSADQNVASFNMSNRSFKLALMSNQTKLAVANPFDIDGTGAKAAGYVDLLGAINAAAEGDEIDASETTPARISKQRASRRGTLADTDNNESDFSPVDYRTADMTIPRPRTSSEGAWDPVTGEGGAPQEPGDEKLPLTITFYSEADFDGVTARYTLSGTENLDITLTNHAKYSAVYYTLNENAPVPVSGGKITITAANLKKSNYLLIVVSLNGFEYSKPIEIVKS